MRYASPVKEKVFRLLVDPPMEGARNMARDVAILDAVVAGKAPPTLRLYSWAPPCLSLGRHQGPDAVDFPFCREHGIDVVRRPTGGRAVLHHLELTYAVVAPVEKGFLPSNIQEAYSLICGVLVEAFRDLGLETELGRESLNSQLPRPSSTIPCFQAAAGGEILAEGRKLVGSAMRSRGHCILQHGSILLDWDSALQAGAMGVDDQDALRSSVSTLRELLHQVPSEPELINIMVRRFEEGLMPNLRRAEFSSGESAREARLIPEFRIASGDSAP